MLNRLKELRLEHNLTLKELSEKTVISDVNLSRYERGIVSPRPNMWQKLADFFGMSVLTLMSDDEQPEVTLKNDVPTEVIYKGKKYKVITNE